MFHPKNPPPARDAAGRFGKSFFGFGRWAGLVGMAVLAGCAVEKRPDPPAPPPPGPILYEWHGERLEGAARVVIDLRRQIVTVTIGGVYAGWAYTATGKEGHATPAGNFTVLEKVVDKSSTLYGWMVDAEGNVVNPDADIRRHKPPPGGRFVPAPMPYWMRLTWRGIGMHAGPIPRPGEPASHGCIRLPRDFAPLLFERVNIGTPVQIVR